MQVHVLILNYNGQSLMADCLPSVVSAAAASRHDCDVIVIDNASTDDSVSWLAKNYPNVRVIASPNDGLCSFNRVVPALAGPVAVLLNNDVKLAPDCIDPLVEPLLAGSTNGRRRFLSAARCVGFDGSTYEGQKTAVSWRWGLVSATSLFEGHESGVLRFGLTASAGAAIAVDCRLFEGLKGFDPLFLPGRLEDLDFAYRGYSAGYEAVYVPEALAYHLGMGSFEPAFGRTGCDDLALRNTLLFQWKNLRHPAHLLRQGAGLAMRLAADAVCAWRVPVAQRWPTVRALAAAIKRLPQLRRSAFRAAGGAVREWDFFRAFHPRQINRLGDSQ